MQRMLIILFLMAFLFAAMTGCKKAETKDKLSILFIGNSHTFFNEMPDILTNIAKSKEKEVYVDYELCRDGSTLKRHWEVGLVLERIKSRKWDYVVLQEQSQNPINNKEEFNEYVRLLDKEINAANAKTLLYIPNIRYLEKETLEERQRQAAESYGEIADELGVDVVPAGPAWTRSINLNSDIILYNYDNLHSSKDGAYLTACVFYSVLFRESPEGASDNMMDDTDIPDKASILETTAWETVCE